jgi:hypothetical protein
MTKITSAIAAAFIASASFASVALAEEGDYYEGAQQTQQQDAAIARSGVSYGYTGSISRLGNHDAASSAALNRGDYYEGAVRPN